MSRRFIFRALLFALIFLTWFSCQKRPKTQYTIFFTNDLQAHLEPDRDDRGGLARIAYIVKKEREKNPGRVLLLDAGDSSVGTAFGTETNGESVFRVMNEVGYDAVVYGNHEFDLGAEQAKSYQHIAKFPLLACNIRDREEKPFSPEYAIFQLEGLRLAVIGIANPGTPGLVDPNSVSGLKFLLPESEIRRIQNLLSDKADVFIILSHQGIKEDISLAYHISGIPIIIGGHSEVKLSKMLPANETRIAQAGHFGHWLARIDFSFDPQSRTIRSVKYRLIKVNGDIPEDPQVKRLIEVERKNLPAGIERIIGKTKRFLSKDYIGFWTAELIKAEANADIGIINNAGIRSEISRGQIKAEDIYEIMPFQDRICVFEISGYELMRVKSLKYFYFSRGPKLNSTQTYKVASIDYLLKIQDFPGADNVQIFDTLLRDKMIEQIEKDRGFKRFWDSQ